MEWLSVNATTLGHERGRPDAAQRQNAEESLAARVAAIGGKSEKALGGHQRPAFDAIARQPLQIEITAARAVSEAQKRPGDARGVKTLVASVAAPRAQSGGAGKKVRDTTPVRAETIRAAALRTNHLRVIPPAPNARQYSQTRLYNQAQAFIRLNRSTWTFHGENSAVRGLLETRRIRAILPARSRPAGPPSEPRGDARPRAA